MDPSQPSGPWNQASPQPPGGWGPPPPGGFGAPQGGPYGGVPGGYGAPPGGFGPPGFGGPPGPGGCGAPPPPKNNLPIFIGLGCLGLFLLAGIGGGIAFVLARGSAAEPPSRGGDGSSGVIDSPPPVAAESDLKLELQDFRGWKGANTTQYFVGELLNTGDGAIGFPSAKLTFFDAAGTAIESGSCSSLVRVLPPGEKVPCTYLNTKPMPWKTYKIEYSPMKSYFKGQLADLDITGAESHPKAGYDPHTVTGKITNKSSFAAKSVWAVAALYGNDSKIVAADQALVAGKDLAPGGSGLFKVRFYNVAAEPSTYRVIAIGYSE